MHTYYGTTFMCKGVGKKNPKVFLQDNNLGIDLPNYRIRFGILYKTNIKKHQ